ncbi:tRNA (adenosine(37)-N6)-threonylcarbamoyltransferase complex transferase subunit TsaD [Candidatus Fonsibacter ubiquis]|uniref:tRNA (adenosine(37)-N6)-threonylcarbamoyltransferase complex transferase subunit TsaD n=1 Tax=Candidatus Fonsibacter ubiquis TaxID=1925548 RepID=UPI000C07D417|nr:tRNA (adenosine(37)-N6)-threonylcarbamoyltransferase complex transferase subunit TsaD [Candidatus Fonsibacter ubiquis]
MKKDLTFLGIETSCDETAAAVVREDSDGNVKILSNVVSSQVDEHLEFGGVVPENAARSHAEKIDIIIKKAIEDSKCEFTKLDGVAATAGPGLLVCLMVGLSAGKSIAGILKKPFLAVNHLEGHALTPRIFNKIEFPYLLLLVSGGHTQFLIVEGIGRYKRIGTTIDDALGETFDKTAKMIGLEFPGGPKIEKLAENGNENTYVLPRPILNHPGCNLSFAGLKTAILQLSSKIKSEKDRENLAASFQKTINEILNVKCKSAMNEFSSRHQKSKKVFVISGGVAANKSIRNNLHKLSKEMGFENFFPPTELCSDNAAMIAWAGIERFKNGIEDNLEVLAKPRWPLDPKAPFLKGAGVKY